jgi:hypothetical protein
MNVYGYVLDASSTSNDRSQSNGKKMFDDARQQRSIQLIDEHLTNVLNEMTDEQKLARVQELEKKLVGGEELNNNEKRMNRRRKLKEMNERRISVTAIMNVDDDAMIRVVDDVQDKVNSRQRRTVSIEYTCISLV